MSYEPSFNDAVAFTLESEGKLSNNPNDKGGLTKYGITQSFWTAYRAKAVALPGNSIASLPASVASITVDMALAVYHEFFWNASLPRELQGAFFDFAVNSGPGTAARKLQEVLGVTVDGDLGTKTMGKLAVMQAPQLRKLRNDYVTARLVYDMDVAQHNPQDLAFIEGWVRRVTKLYDFAY
jgi:lysozyme family protein